MLFKNIFNKIIFTQKRVGKDGKIFKIYKLRTLKNTNVNVYDVKEKIEYCNRLSPFLRKYHLDEIPQLINVLKREMNLVGPRPLLPAEIKKMNKYEKRIILSTRPGCIDFATLHFLNEEKLARKLKLDEKKYNSFIFSFKKKLQIYYVQNKSFLTDLYIIFLFFTKILSLFFKKICATFKKFTKKSSKN